MSDAPEQRGTGRSDRGGRAGAERASRLKAALKANLGRRKAQARARAEDAEDAATPDPEPDGQQQDG